MPVTIGQFAPGVPSGGNSTITLNGVQNGSAIWILAYDGVTASIPVISGISDGTNTYAYTAGYVDGVLLDAVEIWVADNVVGGNLTITVTGAGTCYAIELVGVQNPSYFGQGTSSSDGVGNGSPTALAVTGKSSGIVVLLYGGHRAAGTPSTPTPSGTAVAYDSGGDFNDNRVAFIVDTATGAVGQTSMNITYVSASQSLVFSSVSSQPAIGGPLYMGA